MKTYYIRYNHEHKIEKSDKIWKVFETEDIYHLANEIEINVPMKSHDTIRNGDTKYSLICQGVMKIEGDKIILEDEKVKIEDDKVS
jgi:hypothetical protein